MMKLYVGGLPWATNDNSLRAAFEVYGEVTEAKVVTDRETGRSRGFGFVSFANEGDAQKALAMNGRQLEGRTIIVNVAREREPRRDY
ncbi:MAG: RNA-binding protein [Myxococcales bacterium]|nr:MAG: RNA-binding protein [Myxococcales bacterium]